MLYPSYREFMHSGRTGDRFSASTLAAPPLMRMKFMNLIANPRKTSLRKNDFVAEMASENPHANVSFWDGNAACSGLLVVPGSLTVDQQISEQGAMLFSKRKGNVGNDPQYGVDELVSLDTDFYSNGSFALPYEITLSTDYTVLHDHPLGFSKKVNMKKVKKARTALNETEKAIKKAKNKSKLRKKRSKQQRILRNLTSGRATEQRQFRRFPYGIEDDKR